MWYIVEITIFKSNYNSAVWLCKLLCFYAKTTIPVLLGLVGTTTFVFQNSSKKVDQQVEQFFEPEETSENRQFVLTCSYTSIYSVF